MILVTTIYKDLRRMMVMIWHWFATTGRFTGLVVYGNNGGRSGHRRNFIGLLLVLRIVVTIVCGDE